MLNIKRQKRNMERDNLLVVIFGVIFLFSIIMLLTYGVKTTGFATTSTTTANVTISVFFAIDMSTNLSIGIEFGNLSTLPATNENASHNYDGDNSTVGGDGTSFHVNVSSDSNTAVDFCIKADDDMKTSGGDVLTAGNESWNNNTDNNFSLPSLASETALTLSYVQAGASVAIGGTNNYRFWLDVPAGQASGNYNNTVSFKGVSAGGSC